MKYELLILDRGRLIMPAIVNGQPMPAFAEGADITWPGLRVPFRIDRVAFGVAGMGDATIFTTALHVSAVRRTEDEDHPVPWPWNEPGFPDRDVQERTHFEIAVSKTDGSEDAHRFAPESHVEAQKKFEECTRLPDAATVRWFQYARGLLGMWQRRA